MYYSDYYFTRTWDDAHYGSAVLFSCLMCNISEESSEGNIKHNGYVVLTDPYGGHSTFTPPCHTFLFLQEVIISVFMLSRPVNTHMCARRLQPIFYLLSSISG